MSSKLLVTILSMSLSFCINPTTFSQPDLSVGFLPDETSPEASSEWTFGEEMTMGIYTDVSSGAVSGEEGVGFLNELLEKSMISEEEYTTSVSEIETREDSYLKDKAEDDLSSGIVDYLVEDVETGMMTAEEAISEIEFLIDNGLVSLDDGGDGISYLETLKTEGVTSGGPGEQGQIFDELDFPQEITIGILNEVAQGEMTAEEAAEQLEIMQDGEWLTAEEVNAASQQAVNLEIHAEVSDAENDLSQEIVDLLLENVDLEKMDKSDAQMELERMNDYGIVSFQDSQEGINGLHEDSKFIEEIEYSILDQVSNGVITADEATAQINEMESQGLISSDQAHDYTVKAYELETEHQLEVTQDDLSEEIVNIVYEDISSNSLDHGVGLNYIEDAMDLGLVNADDGLIALNGIENYS